ncbi:betaine aldehyde dehydrogenase [Mytilinidion resinicola]|uniref:aldehyde dehydrogenase (NAD(+)) n=1 Tax=Mytilinidion resinicola TaxID=574789 RepID=A0A6A6Z2V0_9PEZI|nr:betaine aldehyde dehydrogenase [Mytilinidion resinicola]KAF2815451.1 betaine aldehyde dehydrogenase [Mytilinidion resinicola]
MAPEVSFTSFKNIVNGGFRDAKEHTYGHNPATGEQLWDVPVATKQDVDDAVQAARTAFKSWRKTTLAERKKTVGAVLDVYKRHFREFGDLLLKENGKPTVFADGEAKIIIDQFEFYLDLKLDDEVIELKDRTCIKRWVPVGVVAAILPWNFPLANVGGKMIPALLAGNAIIIKPSPFTPYSALKFVEIAQQVLPPGLVQVLAGDDRLGPWLTHHPDVGKIAFTGSVASGKKVMEAASKTLKRVILELGGNDASIVCPDIDVDEVAPKLVRGAFFNSGQVCATVKRVYVHQDIYDKFLAAAVKAVNAVKWGDPLGADVFLGPTQNSMQFTKVKDIYDDVKDKGYKVAVGGNIAPGNGLYAEPSLIDNPPNDARIVTEEQFAPMLPIQVWSDEEEVIERANDSKMGLGGNVWSKDETRARRIAESLEAGSVFINGVEMLTNHAPYGGIKESGIGLEGGPDAIKGYCDVQVLHTNIR